MDGLELVRSVAERMLHELIEAEATSKIGAEWNEHIHRAAQWAPRQDADKAGR
ncbi:hypothetical protein [Streptomyces sp. NPDC006355]|uniref:hypothetical protein n=1 Tax=Streptomyces sp. NPDC006355 TaxID=3156758 RepID=UPI00339F53B0